MRYRDRILAGTAIGILMAASPMGASAMQAEPPARAKAEQPASPVLLAQAARDDQDQKPGAEEGAEGRQRPAKREAAPQSEEPKARPERQAAPQAEEKPAAPEPKAAAEKPEPKPAAPEPKAAEAPEPKAAAPEAKPARKPERKAAEEAAPAVEPETPKAPAKEAVRPATPKAADQAEEPVAKPAPKAAAEDERPAAKPEAGERRQSGKEEGSQDRRERRDADRSDRRDKGERGNKAPSADRQREPASDKAADRAGEEPVAPKASDKVETPAQPAEKPAAAETDRKQAVEGRDRNRERENGEARGKDRPRGEDRAGKAPAGDNDRNAAPMLDSQKGTAGGREGEARRDRRDGDRNAVRDGDRNAERDRNRDDRGSQRTERRPDSDRAAQRDINVSIEDLRRLDDEKGRRIDRDALRDFRRRDGAQVVKKMGDRTLIEFNNQIIVEDRNHDRVRRHARDVYYEELPDQLRREVVVRPDGSQIVTVRNGYGDIVSRTRIVNGQRYVLLFAGDDRRDGPWHDPAADLPPLRIDIPRSEYILESDGVSDPDRYYEFLDQPPVVPVEQLYSIDQVKYSARVRDMVRRVDLDTVNFATGSAEISKSELPALEAIADAMLRMIDDNPAETFLIEGHTDAVGSDDSNLVLSDERAESVATALTDVYDVPPENLFTQGYGEQYLKVDTEGAQRENRRVAIRRITPLVSPVASAN